MSKSYIPPHNRVAKVEFKAEYFPELVKTHEIVPSKLNFTTLFKKNEEKRQKKKKKFIKKGWVKLTKDGLVDSYTEEERICLDKLQNDIKINSNFNNMVRRWDEHKEMLLERDGYVSESDEESESEDEEEESNEEDDYDDDENEVELQDNSKWLTS